MATLFWAKNSFLGPTKWHFVSTLYGAKGKLFINIYKLFLYICGLMKMSWEAESANWISISITGSMCDLGQNS